VAAVTDPAGEAFDSGDAANRLRVELWMSAQRCIEERRAI
jgi:hypothetical protein